MLETEKMDRVEFRAVIPFGNESPSCSKVKKWAAEFRRGRESLEDYERSRHSKEAPTDENIELVHSLIMCGRRRLCGIAWQIDISFGAVQSICVI